MFSSILVVWGVLVFVLAILILIGVVFFIRWLNRPQRILSFFALTPEERKTYEELHNRIDTQVGTRLARKLPLTIGMAIFTGGTSLFLTGARAAFAYGKQGEQIKRVKTYVEDLRVYYGCKYINWNTFPASHIELGVQPLKNNHKRERCCICKKNSMHHFSGSSTCEIYVCDNCGKVLTVNRSSAGIPESLLVPGLYVGAIPLAGELHDIAIDLGGSLLDGAGMLLDFLG